MTLGLPDLQRKVISEAASVNASEGITTDQEVKPELGLIWG